VFDECVDVCVGELGCCGVCVDDVVVLVEYYYGVGDVFDYYFVIDGDDFE